jgi:hypothetical protein
MDAVLLEEPSPPDLADVVVPDEGGVGLEVG